jgi:phosphopantetheinyl transferase (holo-ACP synthase)
MRTLAESLAVDAVFVALAHTAELASATVVLESRHEPDDGRQPG